MIDTQTSGYDAIRQGSALIDWTGTVLLEVGGPGRSDLLRAHITRDLDFLLEGQSLQALILDEQGKVLSDVIVHGLEDTVLVQVWPCRAADEIRRAFAVAAAELDDVTVVDRSEDFTVLGVEGPASFTIVDRFLDYPVSSMAYRAASTVSWEGHEVIVSRNGVTGEFGYLFLAPTTVAADLRSELISLGAVEAQGEAVDICRMEMRFPNVDAESGEDGASPFELGLQWMVDFHGGSRGTEAALSSAEDTDLPVCWVIDDESAQVPTVGAPVAVDGTTLGAVSHAVWSPTVGRPVGTARLRRDCAASGLALTVAGAPARTVSAPFLIATSFTTTMA